MAKVPFTSVFTINPDGSIVTIGITRFGGIQLPPGFLISPEMVINAISLASYKDRDLEVTVDNGVNVITGIY